MTYEDVTPTMTCARIFGSPGIVVEKGENAPK